MIVWQKPSFDELAMNAEIGAYQPEPGDDERGDERYVEGAQAAQVSAPVNPASGG